ncbi:MAG TPA: hypothetical protein EYQ60_01850, partial [Myxococcales bacterium]|nr:hypothetical protein [Myxococcales bacterium]
PDNDIDSDTISGEIDNCPAISNLDQLDADGDGQGNVCDAFPNDRDNDGVVDRLDECPEEQLDTITDNDGDGCDDCSDYDLDGIVNARDMQPDDPSPQTGTDRRASRLWLVSTEAPPHNFESTSDAFGDTSVSFVPDGDLNSITINSLRDLQSETTFERFLAATRDRNVLTEMRRTLQTDLSQGLSPESFSEIEIEMADMISNLRSRPGGAQDHVVYLAKRPANSSEQTLFDNGLYLSSTNRFNSSCEGGEAIVFVDEQDTAIEIADRVAHQAGHLFGLRHISSAPTRELEPSCFEDVFEPVFEPVDAAVMDFDFGREVAIEYRGACGTSAQACDAVEPPSCEAQDARGWFDGDILGSHSPRFHLLRHVLGTPQDDISFAPGNWDQLGTRDQDDAEFETRIASFDLTALASLENGLQTVFDVRVSVAETLDSVERVVYELAEISIETEELAGTIVMPATGYLRIVAKSIQGGPYDLQLVEVDGNPMAGDTIGVDTSGLIQVANAELQLAVVQRTNDEVVFVSDVS